MHQSVARLEYARNLRYSPKTCTGNWFEERCQYEKQRHNHISTYKQDYVPKPNSKLDNDVIWDNYFKSAGCPKHLLFDHDGDEYKDNFSTTYDLSYNHFVRKAKMNPTERQWSCKEDLWLPEVDFTKNYGNITDYGLLKYKKSLWEDEKSDPRVTDKTKSEYQDCYVPPDKEATKIKRWAVPRQNASLMNKNNIQYAKLKLRDMPLFNVTPNDELVIIPRPRKCNPITWQCCNDLPDNRIQRFSK